MTNEVILCVDDENDVLQCLKTELIHLFGRQFSIEIAESGPEALAIFTDLLNNQAEIPIVISDYIMPNMKGDELLQQIYRMSPKTRTVLLTGQAKLEGITNAVNHANLFHYLEKPWNKEELKTIIDKAMDQYRQNKTLASEHSELSRNMAALQAEIDQKTLELQDIKQTLAGRDNRDPNVPTTGEPLINLLRIEEIYSSLNKIKSNIDSFLGQSSSVGQNMLDGGQSDFGAAVQAQLFQLNREEIERITSMINQVKEGHK